MIIWPESMETVNIVGEWEQRVIMNFLGKGSQSYYIYVLNNNVYGKLEIKK